MNLLVVFELSQCCRVVEMNCCALSTRLDLGCLSSNSACGTEILFGSETMQPCGDGRFSKCNGYTMDLNSCSLHQTDNRLGWASSKYLM